MNQISKMDQAMLDRAAIAVNTSSVMDGIHKVKAYNANFNIGEKIDEEKAGKFRLMKGTTMELEYIDGFKFDVLGVCKVKSGSVYLLNEMGDTIKDENGKSKSTFFFTNEHSIYTRKTDILGLKGNGNIVGFMPKGEMEEMLRSKKINGNDNPFWKQGKKLDGEPYNDSYLSDTYILYGKFLEGPLEGEYFKFVPLSLGAFGKTFKDGEKCLPEEGTFLAAVNKGIEEYNLFRVNNKQSKVASIAFDQLDMSVKIRVAEINDKRIFIPEFTYVGLSGMRGDNTADLTYILDLQAAYLEEQFGVKVLTENYRLGSIHVDTINPNQIDLTGKTEIVEGEVEQTQKIVAQAPTSLPKTSSIANQYEGEELSIENIPF